MLLKSKRFFAWTRIAIKSKEARLRPMYTHNTDTWPNIVLTMGRKGKTKSNTKAMESKMLNINLGNTVPTKIIRYHTNLKDVIYCKTEMEMSKTFCKNETQYMDHPHNRTATQERYETKRRPWRQWMVRWHQGMRRYRVDEKSTRKRKRVVKRGGIHPAAVDEHSLDTRYTQNKSKVA